MANQNKKECWSVIRGALLIIIVILILLSVWLSLKRSEDTWNTQNTTLVILALTLIALIVYTYETYRIASIESSRWEQENTCRAYYMITRCTDDSVQFSIINDNPIFVVRAKVDCGFKIYGEDVDYSDDYNGKNTWYIFPKQGSQGHFEISQLLSKKGKTIQNMAQERTDRNCEIQLTMDLKIKFKDEQGGERELPSRRHSFDFKNKCWIPEIAKKDDWLT